MIGATDAFAFSFTAELSPIFPSSRTDTAIEWSSGSRGPSDGKSRKRSRKGASEIGREASSSCYNNVIRQIIEQGSKG